MYLCEYCVRAREELARRRASKAAPSSQGPNHIKALARAESMAQQLLEEEQQESKKYESARKTNAKSGKKKKK